MIPLQAGKLRHRVQVQARTEGRDEYGGVALDWSTVATRWASVEPLSGSERIDAAAVEAQVTHRVIMRSQVSPRPTPRNRLLFKGRIFRIENVLDFEERSWSLELMVREEVGDA